MADEWAASETTGEARARPTRRAFLRDGTLAGLALAVAACSRTPARNLSLEREVVRYGTEPGQEGDLLIPLSGTAPYAVVVLIHGGYWKAGFDRTTITPMADALGRLGYAVWNIDYRVTGAGGGWPTTFEDAALAVDHLAALADTKPLDLDRIAVVGHSAGGQLALWVASRPTLPSDAPGPAPAVRATAAVSLAGALDLVAGVDSPVGPNGAELRAAIIDVVGGTPASVPERYQLVAPIARVPLGVPQLIIHGDRDETVPVEHSRAYVRAASAAGDTVRLAELPQGDHLEVARVDRPAWDDLTRWLLERVPVTQR